MKPNPPETASPVVPKLWGTDIELGNFIRGIQTANGTGAQASRMLLRQIQGLPSNAAAESSATNPETAPDAPRDSSDAAGPSYGTTGYTAQDWGRKCLPGNAGFAYVDLDHLEICTPETRSVVGHIGLRHAMLRIAARARDEINAKLRPPYRLEVVANNSDGQGNAFGSHLNILTSREAYDRLFNRPHYIGTLAAFQASHLVVSGQGKAGSENGRPPCPFQISQRADFIESLMGPQTTFNRPLVNSRDEALAGWRSDAGAPANRLARLHIIYLDNALCHGSIFLAATHMILLAQMEREQVNPRLQLDDPVSACWQWSHDPGLSIRLPLVDGTRVTAVELQRLFAEDAAQFIHQGGCDGGIFPEAPKVLDYWIDTLEKLDGGKRLDELVGRLDWVLKKFLLERAIEAQGLTWESPRVKYLDHLYASLDRNEGLYWQAERAGLIERFVDDAEIDRLTREPPEDSRAWTRAMILRALEPESIQSVDWDAIHFYEPGSCWARKVIRLSDPLAFVRNVDAPSACPPPAAPPQPPTILPAARPAKRPHESTKTRNRKLKGATHGNST